ncbi:MAG TPA: LuxR C-terminal-related transcriptional regulator [Streptosporangiaceae bacterium]
MTADLVLRLGNLPAEPNSFVGRERDLGDLKLLLSSVRALTLCGPGGIGKTRLATRLGWELAAGFPDGVWLAELADTEDPALVARRIASVLGIAEEPDRTAMATLADALRGRQLLLILDTCEHVVEAVASMARDLIGGCPLIRLVATSREPLRVRGETVWRVQPLSLPNRPGRPLGAAPADAPAEGWVPPQGAPPERAAMAVEEAGQFEAVRLFVDRAAAVRPGFALTAANSPAVAQLCRTLDGVPLAIELAAARVRTLSVEQISARIADRFRLLASGDRTAPPRQQTLQATVDWSYELLTADEQTLLRRLSVFTGWSLEMAEQVCTDSQIPAERVLDLLAALIDKSLAALEDELAGDARYRLLDTIRDYAADRLAASGEQEQYRRRHADYLLTLAENVTRRAFARDALAWPEQVRLYNRMAAERPNYRVALTYCLQQRDAPTGLRLCSALRPTWVVQGDVTEGIGWFAQFLALAEPVPVPIRVTALMMSADLAFEHQDYRGAATTAQAALDLGAHAEVCLAGAQRMLALISLGAGQQDQALAYADAAIAAARAHANEWEEGLALAARAAILSSGRQLADAQAAFEAALDLLAHNNGWGLAHALYGLGALARARQDNAAAVRHFRRALDLLRQLDARTEMARCLAGIGLIALAELDLPAAQENLTESLELSLAAGQRLGIARGLEAFGALAVLRGDNATALRLEGAAAAARELLGPAQPQRRRSLGAVLAAAEREVGADEAVRLRGEGRRLGLHEAVGYALASSTAAAPEAPDLPAPAAPSASDPDPPSLAAAASGAANPAAGPGPASTPAARASHNGADSAAASVLTTREQEIALLIARGLSNRGIAAELVISPATVARHVANILAKLGLSSRAQVAAWTVDQRPGFGSVR